MNLTVEYIKNTVLSAYNKGKSKADKIRLARRCNGELMARHGVCLNNETMKTLIKGENAKI